MKRKIIIGIIFLIFLLTILLFFVLIALNGTQINIFVYHCQYNLPCNCPENTLCNCPAPGWNCYSDYQSKVDQKIPEPDANNPYTYKNCQTDANCKLVKFGLCNTIDSINSKIPDEFWNKSKKNDNTEIPYKCAVSEFDFDNMKPICENGMCRALQKDTRYAKENEHCYMGSKLIKNQCQVELVCVNKETGKMAGTWESGICIKKSACKNCNLKE
jgi:hypothetical protein